MSEQLRPALGDLPAGARIASYQVEELIGRGGMAAVYRASDVRLGRQVALKVLAPELARDDAFRQRFIRESRAGAAVDHPNVIPVFEAGESDGVLFIAMRYVTGQDVRALIARDGKLPASRVVSIVTQVASALDAGHAHGLVHRDVKPANMLLAAPGDGSARDHIYLSDFGLSKQSVSASSLTGTGQFLGTIDYMSPEQIEGRPVDGRTDLYALGCATFEMLTGQPPFRREQNLAVMWAQVSAAPPSVLQLRPALRAEVDAVLAKALAKAPADRHASCLDFATALRIACRVHPMSALEGGAPGTGRAATELAYGPAAGGGAVPGLGMAAGAGAAPEIPGPATVTDSVPGSGLRALGLGGGPAGPAGGSGYGPGGPGYGPDGATDPPGWPGAPQQSRPPRRVLPALLGVLAVLALAGAALLVLHLRGSGQPQAGPAHTVTETVPASPTTASTGSPAASQAGTPPPAAAPADVLNRYYAAINNHDYAAAWDLLSSTQRSARPYATFKQGFDGTAHDTLDIVSVSGDAVSMRLTASQTDGTVKYFAGTYYVQDGLITGWNVTQTG
ncbi:MAG TPA: serine/threonine-protein kinase [Streptosporangiaceae bacterium]|nr:serine/threonine-protein kinase [Streptosporangiaceae bacterium]